METTIQIEPLEVWQSHISRWKACTRCESICKSKHVLYPRGTLPCDLLFVGIAPGTTEDSLGFPMTGPTKQIVDNWIVNALPIGTRWAIQNIVACMPRDEENYLKARDPYLEEIDNCRERLIEFVKLAEPGKVVLLGDLAKKKFPREEFPELEYLCLPHPASLIRSADFGRKRNVEDITAQAVIDLTRFARS